MNIEGVYFTENQRIAWHYVMDIHDSGEYWYSLLAIKLCRSKKL